MTSEYQFEDFSPTGGRFTPLISLGRAGSIGISSGFIKKYNLKDSGYTGAKLMYDKIKLAIGISFMKEKVPGALRLVYGERGGGYINAKEFLVRFDIDREKYNGRYHPKEVASGQEKIFVIELKERK